MYEYAMKKLRDHPRSRGVYASRSTSSSSTPGSSPLARGLRLAVRQDDLVLRIIPARAGVTRPGSWRHPWNGDHPRSRGVYTLLNSFFSAISGSSPLARGLPAGGVCARGGRGIIPARAGFTNPVSAGFPPPLDHPRSRGVYLRCAFSAPIIAGSSPLARGLPASAASRFPR